VGGIGRNKTREEDDVLKKISAFHLLSVTSSQSNPTMIMKPEVLVSGALCTTLSTAAG